MVHLQENDMIHGDIRPDLISVPIQPGDNFKLMDRLGDPSPPNQAQLNNLRKNKDIYMSPILFNSLMNKERKIKHNPFKSDIFSLGLIILQVGLLKPVQNIYDYNKKIFNENALVELVDEFFMKYSDSIILQEILMNMLEFSEKSRQEPKKLLSTLRKLKIYFLAQKSDNSNVSGNVSLLDKLNFENQGYNLKENHLINLSYIYGKSPMNSKSLHKSLASMMKEKNSQNQYKSEERLLHNPQEVNDNTHQHSKYEDQVYREIKKSNSGMEFENDQIVNF